MLEMAKWISFPEDRGFEGLLFRKRFRTDREVRSAVLQITAHGCYEARLNGARVGEFVFAPGCTSLRRVQVQTYDVTKELQKDNCLDVLLSKGWFKGRISWRGNHDYPDMLPCILAQLQLTYADGGREILGTDGTWEAHPSRVRFTDFYDGEIYDATFSEEEWVPAVERDYSRTGLVAQQGPEVREQERLRPIRMIRTPKGETVVDFGQNLTGYFTVRVNARAGDRVSFSFAEELDSDGNFYTENYRAAKARFEYICREGEQEYTPKLAFWGYRYIRVDAFPGCVDRDSITAVAVHSELRRTGWLRSSSPLLNQLFQNIIWGQKGNFLDIPTDCPQRDERMGWTGDAEVFCKTAAYNYDVEAFFDKWLTDLRLDQTPDGGIPHVIPQLWDHSTTSAAWGDAAVIVPWQMYLAYGDRRLLARQYPSMKGYLEYIRTHTTTKDLWTGCPHFGDWLAMDGPVGDCKGATRMDFIASAFYAYSTSLVIRIGDILGRKTEKYRRLYERIVRAFRKTYPEYTTQTECVLALRFGLATDPGKTAAQLADMIRKNGNRLQTGFVGTPHLLHVLSDNGYTELAYTLLLQENFPSWLYSVKRGATTIWEHWDGRNEKGEFWSASMNSFNHYAFGSVADWVYEVACGIRPVEEKPGFAQVVVEPHPTAQLDELEAIYDSRHGRIRSRWYRRDGTVRYEITVPVRATLVIEGKEYRVERGTYLF